MVEKGKQDYFIGLDIGTNSVGWAVSNLNYEVIKKNGKFLAGSRLFTEAKTAEGRRVFRSSRRRLGRRKFRLELLQRLFAEKIAEKDFGFFIRMKESFLHLDDKQENNKNKFPLFNDKNYTDKEFYDKFPTIYHLREFLLNNKTDDIRLLYLACHHIVKYRGHFLKEGNFDIDDLSALDSINKINESLINFFGEDNISDDFKLSTKHASKIDEVIKDTKLKDSIKISHYLFATDEQIAKLEANDKKAKGEQLDETGFKAKPNQNRIVSAVAGNKVDLQLFVIDKEDKEKYEEHKDAFKKLNFTDEGFDEAFAVLQTNFEKEAEVVLALKDFYSAYALNKVLQGETSFSAAMTKQYKKHSEDLKRLKKFIKEAYGLKTYNKVFRNHEIKNNYPSYIGSNNTNTKVGSQKYQELKANKVAHSILVLGKKAHAGEATNEIVNADGKNVEFSGKEFARCSYDDFLKYITAVLDSKKDSLNEDQKKEYDYFKDLIENKELMPRTNTSVQSLMPHQLNEIELNKILDNNKHFGLDKEKIISLLTFRIPYYVGPLNNTNDKFAWVTKNENFKSEKYSTEQKELFNKLGLDAPKDGQITPWEFDKAIDKNASAEQFIKRMTNKCTYLKAYDVIPKQSLLYQKYMVLCNLNDLKINGNRINQKLKETLFNEYMPTLTSTTKPKIQKWLAEKGLIEKGDKVGNDNDTDNLFNSSLSSQIKIAQAFGVYSAENPTNGLKDNSFEFDFTEMAEDIIRWHTLFNGEKNIVEEKIEQVHGKKLKEIFTDEKTYKETIKRLKGMNFTGWAKFSGEFLTDIKSTANANADKNLKQDLGDIGSGETFSILELLEKTTTNLMEILNSNNYSPMFLDICREKNSGNDELKIDYNYVKELYCSPSVKRAIWQTNLIVDEIAHIMGKAPKKVFIEVTRGEDKNKKGKMQDSRLKQLKAYFDGVKKENAEAEHFKNLLDGKDEKQLTADLRGDRLYFYYLQFGKCGYCGNQIDFGKLSTDMYDIDHIYPQAKIKDDSLNNRILCCRSHNADKSDVYPLPTSIQTRMKGLWQAWYNASGTTGMFSKDKLERLTRTTPLTEDEMLRFINRQLVSTNQSVKEVAELLKIKFKNIEEDENKTKIVYSKAGNVSEFRKIFDIPKSREVNNLHHAKDAYLNIVVGNLWDSEYGDLRHIKGKNKAKAEEAQNQLRQKTNEVQDDDIAGKKQSYNENRLLTRLFGKHIKGVWVPAEKIKIGTEKKQYKDYKTNETKTIEVDIFEKDEKGKIKYVEGSGSIATVKKFAFENRYLVTTRPFEKSGEMFDQTKHWKKSAKIAFKETKTDDDKLILDTKKYGGYTTQNGAYLVVCESDDKTDKKTGIVSRKITVQSMPLMYAARKQYQGKENLNNVIKLMEELNGLKNVKIIVPKIPLWSLIEVDDIRYRIRAVDLQLAVDYEWFVNKE